MKIKTLNLQNVKCFKELNLNFVSSNNDILNHIVLVGRNGTGKSTILKSIVEVLIKLYKNYNEEIYNQIKSNCFTDKDIYFNEKFLTIAIEFELDTNEASKMGTDHFSILYAYMKSDPNHVFGFFLPTESEDETNYKKQFPTFIELLQNGKALYFDAFRYMSCQNPSGPNIQNNAKPSYSLLQSNIDIFGKTTKRDIELKQWIINIDYMRLKKASNRYELLYNHLVKAFDLLLHPLKFDCINEEGEIIFYDNVNNESIGVNLLSDGFKSIFQIIIGTMRMLFENANENELFYLNSGIVIVDEIDCHIHPRWQKSIMPSLTELFPNCQFIVTTHSPYIVESVQDCEVIRIGDKPIV